MARNWDSAERGGLGTIIDAYQEGQDRQRAIAKQKADSQKAGEEYAFTHTKNYRKPKVDDYGFVTGYETNADTRARNTPILEKNRPEFFRDQPAAAPAAPSAPAAPAPEVDYTKGSTGVTPSGRPLGNEHPEMGGNRAPQGSRSPEPLLVNPELKKIGAQAQADAMVPRPDMPVTPGAPMRKTLDDGTKLEIAQGTDRVEYDPENRRYTGTKNGVDQYEIAADKAHVTGSGLDVTGGAPAGAGPAANQEAAAAAADRYNPDDYMMGRITDLATAHSPRAVDQMISGKAVGRAIGKDLPDVQLPASMWRSILLGEYGLEKAKLGKEGSSLDAQFLPYVRQVEGGTDPGEAIEAFQEDFPGEKIPKAFTDALYKAQNAALKKKGQADANDRANKTDQRVRQGQSGKVIADAVKATLKAYSGFMDQSANARAAKRLANMKDTRGVKRAIQTMIARASGEKGALSNQDVAGYGGSEAFFDQLEQFASTRLEGEGLTPTNVKIINRLTDEFLRAAKQKARAEFGAIARGVRTGVRGYGGDPDAAERAFAEDLGPDALLVEPPEEKKSGKSATEAKPGADVEKPSSPEAEAKLRRQLEYALKKVDQDTSLSPQQKRINKQKKIDQFNKMVGK